MVTLGQECIDTFNLEVKSYLKCYKVVQSTSTIEPLYLIAGSGQAVCYSPVVYCRMLIV